MAAFENAKTGNRLLYAAAFFLLLLAAFVKAFQATHDLIWPCDGDFNRDMAFAQGFLNDGFGKDPNFPGQYIWYNPLLTTIEALISRWTGLPLNIVLTRAGIYLDLLCPVAFFFMMVRLTDWKKALAAAISYIFLASGMLPPFYTATYSAWSFPNCFIQFIYFVNIVLLYKAYDSGKLKWFLILGASLGLSFLGHTAPTLLILLSMFAMHVVLFFRAGKARDFSAIKKYLLQGIVAAAPFVLVSFPLLYYIVGKYHLHSLNRQPFEYVDTIFIWRNWKDMVRQNLSIFLLVSGIGFVWFVRHERNPLVRRILFNWLFMALFMYLYSSSIVGLDKHLHMELPGTVPSFHYFVYLKALQSVFFGYGFLFLAGRLIDWSRKKIFATSPTKTFPYADTAYVAMVVLVVMLWFPKYAQRPDFVQLRGFSQRFAADSAKIGTYYYIMNNVPSDKVILCGEHSSIFPVMATARKMVSIGITFSNPYLEFPNREKDRNEMMHFLEMGTPASAAPLVDNYNVDYVLVENDSIVNKSLVSPRLNNRIFENARYSLFKLDRPGGTR